MCQLHQVLKYSLLIFTLFLLRSCTPIDLYEKNEPIPKHSWDASFRPQFSFEIRDTTAPYQLYITLRHNARYHFNNIWLNIHVKLPDGSTQRFTEIEMPLASKDRGWLGEGMDDIYEQRIGITLDPAKFSFSKSGVYTFTIEHIMREDPLQNVMNVGLRLEKKPR
ncbi:MAG TPA: gliding motility lipoprotein GldH [Flavisolibacter sp.]